MQANHIHAKLLLVYTVGTNIKHAAGLGGHAVTGALSSNNTKEWVGGSWNCMQGGSRATAGAAAGGRLMAAAAAADPLTQLLSGRESPLRQRLLASAQDKVKARRRGVVSAMMLTSTADAATASSEDVSKTTAMLGVRGSWPVAGSSQVGGAAVAWMHGVTSVMWYCGVALWHSLHGSTLIV